MKVTLYTKPACVQCRASAKKLDLEGIEYTTIDMTTDASAFAYVRDHLGFAQAPVIVTDEDAWSGYQPARIEAINTNTGENNA